MRDPFDRRQPPTSTSRTAFGAFGALLAGCSVFVGAASAQTTPESPFESAGGYPAARHGGNYMHNYYFPPAPSSTPWAPAWAPDGDSIAVAMSGSIWRVDPGTGAAEELTSGPGYHSLPAWSPDGRYLAYTVDDNGKNIGIGLLDIESGEQRMLLDDERLYTDPTFSPDGTKLAYVTTAPSGYFNVRIREYANRMGS